MSTTPDYINLWGAIKEIRSRLNELELSVQGITLLITSRQQPPEITKPTKDYHTHGDVRGLIIRHMDELFSYFGDREFHVSSFRKFLEAKTTLLDGDHVVTSNKSKSTRWQSTVRSTIYDTSWEENPIVPAGGRGMYQLSKPKERTQMVLTNVQS